MITTRTGDDGMTTWKNIRVSKNSNEIHWLGLLDQAMADVCLARIAARQTNDAQTLGALDKIHAMLNDVCAVLAADAQRDLLLSLTWCDRQTRGVELDRFVDFGTTSLTAAQINRARTSVRLAESYLPDACDDQNPLIRLLLNRISDALFVLSLNAANT